MDFLNSHGLGRTVETLSGIQFAGNSALDWSIALIMFLTFGIVLRIAMSIVIGRLKILIPKTKSKIDDVVVSLLGEIGVFTYASVALFIAARPLSLPAIIDKVIFGLFLLAALFQIIRIAERVVIFIIHRVWFRRRGNADQTEMWGVLVFVVRLVLWSVGLLMLLSNLGFDVSSLVASLGITGIAVALAVQNILGDLFSSFSLYLDEPFKVGDFIVVGEHMGVVKKIGLKTTRLQALQGEEIVISNKELTTIRVQNYKRMDKRRVEFIFTVMHETPYESVDKIVDITRGILEREKDVTIDRVHFKAVGEKGFDFEVVYYIQSGEHKVYMDIQQRINLALVKELRDEGIFFAYSAGAVRYSQVAPPKA